MSAIFGILRFDGAAVSSRDLERMGHVLAHRGPDRRKFVTDGAVGLGHCLMRVNQEDLFEAQPLRDREADITLVADCRIDNREELAGIFGIGAAVLRDLPDSALVLRAYKEWAEDCAEHLLGDFAFAIWDGRAKKLVLGRDHMGQRYVHYHLGKDFFAFATEIKALWALPDVPRQLSEIMIGKILMQSLDRPKGATLYDGIKGLPGGTTLSLTQSGAISIHSFWEPRADPAHVGRDEAYYVKTYGKILEEAVACRLRRLIHPPALCFSGGFDSGAIAALAGPTVTAQNRKLIAAASVAAEGYRGPARDARPAVELCRRHMPHLDVRYYVRGTETLFSDLERSFMTMDGPSGNDYVHRGLFAIAAGAGARLVMDGHGGDYTINFRGGPVLGRWLRTGQFRRFAREFREHRRATGQNFWRALRHEVIPSMVPLGVIGAWRAVKRGFVPLWSTGPIRNEFARRLIESGAVDPKKLRGQPEARKRWRDWCQRILRMQSGGTPALSISAAAAGLEFSRPFHDRRVVEFALAIPENLYVKDGRDRYLARQALGAILPIEFQSRGRGNDTHDPDFLRMARSVAGGALAEARRLDQGGRLSRFIDFDKLQYMADECAESDSAAQFRLANALRAIALARFLAWFDRQNRQAARADCDQEPKVAENDT